MNLPPNDNSTRRLWYWEWDGGGIYVRLTDSCAMQRYDVDQKVWLPIDDYYLTRASQDPDFIDLTDALNI